MISVDEALAAIDSVARPLPVVETSLTVAVGCVLAEDVRSDIDSPPHNKALMDGYAVVSSDRATRRRVVEEVVAGQLPIRRVEPGTATRIMTGAIVPVGADAIVPVERTQMIDDSTVELEWVDPPAGKHIMPRGELLRRGDLVLRSGHSIGSASVGLLAEVGAATVAVVGRPIVALLPTGNELVSAAQLPVAGQIRNSNGPMLAAALDQLGYRVDLLSVVGDDRELLAEQIAMGLDSDVLVLTGGVSAGKLDLVPDVLESLGVERVFHKVAVKPGKPIWFGTKSDSVGDHYVFGLPGNPVSSFVGFHVFVKRLLARLAGQEGGVFWPSVRLAQPIDNRGDRELFYPVTLAADSTGGIVATPTAWRGSSDLGGIAGAHGLARVPATSRGSPDNSAENESVQIVPLFDDLGWFSPV